MPVRAEGKRFKRGHDITIHVRFKKPVSRGEAVRAARAHLLEHNVDTWPRDEACLIAGHVAAIRKDGPSAVAIKLLDRVVEQQEDSEQGRFAAVRGSW